MSILVPYGFFDFERDRVIIPKSKSTVIQCQLIIVFKIQKNPSMQIILPSADG